MITGHQKDLLVKKSYFWFVILMMALLVVFLLWVQQERVNAHQDYHDALASETGASIAEEVSRFVLERNRIVQVFARQHVDAIRALAASPYSEKHYKALEELIKEYFPSHFAFTVANSEGEPYFENFDGLVAESCQADIKSFAEKQYYHPYVHPNFEGYHFDVMANYGDKEGVLFISFHVDHLAAILKAAETPGHQLMLTYPALNNLIEVISKGARNLVMRNDYRLSKEESARILIDMPVTGTRWDVVDMAEPGLFEEFESKIFHESIVTFLIFLLVGVFMIRRLRREEFQRATVEKQKQELMGVISHEFRTPAAAIHNSLHLIERQSAGKLDGETKNLIEIASNNTIQLLSLVNDFLDLQKLESGKLEIKKAICELKPILENAVKNNDVYAEKFGVSFVINDTLPEVNVYCDALRIEQVLANLLSNAAKYGAKNDVIEILVSQPAPERVRVSIIDHGSGIAEHVRDRVFEKFVMARTEKSGKVRSSGLGLSISKAIIEEHGGTIGYESRGKEGTTFYFELAIVE